MKATNKNSESYTNHDNKALPLNEKETLTDDQNLTDTILKNTPTPDNCQVVFRYNPLNDKMYKRYVCTNPGCFNESSFVDLDKNGQCPDCQVKQARQEYKEEDYIQTVLRILEDEALTC